MNWLAVQENVFIRPTPTGDVLGGVARHTRESILLCEAAGFDVIIIETVGVGQSETEVHSMVDFFLLLMLAGAGDELQGIKRGIIEMADAIVITKADGDNKVKAEEALRSYQNALHLYSQREDGWMPKVHTCSSLEGWKIDTAFFNDNIANLIQQDFFGNQTWKEESIKYQEKVKKGLLSPFQAAEEMYAKFKANR
jgi:LAO/AO transport system kinase